MELGEICIHCMSGIIRDGICTHCGKEDTEEDRIKMALPARHMLCGRQYCLGRVLGSGGFGITYLAWDQKNNRRVAIKEFFPRHLVVRDGQDRRIRFIQENKEEFQHCKLRFWQEAKTLYDLRKVPEVINIYHLFEENGTAYFAMEFLEGNDLKGYLGEKGVIQWMQFQMPVRMLLRALHAIHSRQLIHRDISPGNIFMLKDGRVKLIDFGNARLYTSNNPLTRILNTRFAPLEQFADERKQGPWTDIYSLSVTIYYVLCGILPPSAPERMSEIKNQGNDPARPLHMIKTSVPVHVARAVEQGMAVTVQQRYKNVQEFAEQLFAGEDIFQQKALYHQNTAGQKLSSNQAAGMKNGFPILHCVQGNFKGKKLMLRPGITETLGRYPGVSVEYPDSSLGISRHQCSFMLDNKGIVYVQDDGSSYGTKLNGKKMSPFKWYHVRRGDTVSFAREEYKLL